MTYHEMASLYDKLMQDAPCDDWVTFTKEVLNQYDKKVEIIADLGCGTGEVTIRLANEGYKMYGIDYSSDMLTWAEQKGSALNLAINWVHQDLRELAGIENLDVAVSYCDVINYITSKEELESVFKRVQNSLKAGGLFIFDVHSLNYAQNKLMNHTFSEVTDDFTYIWECFEGENLGEMFHELTFFTLSDGDQYNRFDEVHHQRTYSPEFYKKLLQQSGFKNVILCSDFSFKNQNLDEKAERIFVIAEKGLE